MTKDFKSLKEFYPFYLTEHSNFICRTLHFIGTTIVLMLFVASFVSQTWWLLALIPVAGYGFAWFGHFVFEKNRPATFKHPFYSFASDFMMYWDIVTFQLPKKLSAAQKLYSIE